MSEQILVCAGDISGDSHAARLFARLKSDRPGLKCFGVGGNALEAEGGELLEHSQNIAVIGPSEALKILPRLAALQTNIVEQVRQRQPKLALLVDYGGFNLKLAAKLKAEFPQMPIVYFISPQVWGSRPWRINTIARLVCKMLVIFPFEETLYRTRGINAQFVGHPLVEKFAEIENQVDIQAFCTRVGLDPNKKVIGIFPGSRTTEIRTFMGSILKAIAWLSAEMKDVQFVISEANQKIGDEISDQLFKNKATYMVGSTIKLIRAEDNYNLMATSTMLWTKSGTTTLEATLMAKPMLVFYRGNWISYLIFLLFKTVKYIAWPNLLSSKMLVPELIQLDCRAEQLVRYSRDWLQVPGALKDITQQLDALRRLLGRGDFAANAAAEVEKILDQQSFQRESAQA